MVWVAEPQIDLVGIFKFMDCHPKNLFPCNLGWERCYDDVKVNFLSKRQNKIKQQQFHDDAAITSTYHACLCKSSH